MDRNSFGYGYVAGLASALLLIVLVLIGVNTAMQLQPRPQDLPEKEVIRPYRFDRERERQLGSTGAFKK